MTYNIGSAILILGAIYLHMTFNLDIIVTFFLCLLGIATWAYQGFSDERHGYFRAMIKYYDARADYYKKRTDLLSFRRKS